MPKSTVSATAKRCSSPASASTPPSTSDLREPKEEEEEMEVGNGVDRVIEGKADTQKPDTAQTVEEKMEVDEAKTKPESTGGGGVGTPATQSPGAPSRPLKVRIKTIKTSTGGITRTVTRVAPKGGAAAAGKGLEGKGRKVPSEQGPKDGGLLWARSRHIPAESESAQCAARVHASCKQCHASRRY